MTSSFTLKVLRVYTPLQLMVLSGIGMEIRKIEVCILRCWADICIHRFKTEFCISSYIHTKLATCGVSPALHSSSFSAPCVSENQKL